METETSVQNIEISAETLETNMETETSVQNFEISAETLEINMETSAKLKKKVKILYPKNAVVIEEADILIVSDSVVVDDPLEESEPSLENFCNVCKIQFETEEKLTIHLSNQHEDKPFECLTCGKRFLKAPYLRLHQKGHNKRELYPHKCSHCDKVFLWKSKVDEHERTHTGEAPMRCDICEKSFKSHSTLIQHMKKHGPKEFKPPPEFFCDCGKLFHTKREMDWHKESKHRTDPLKCRHCRLVFIHESQMTLHIRRMHDPKYVPPNARASDYEDCPVCEKTFCKTSLKKHMKVKHEGVKEFQCETCKEFFASKSILETHEWTHKMPRARPFKCTLCPKAYTCKTYLERHLKVHDSTKPFQCNECGLRFTNKHNLKRHDEERHGEKSFACHICRKKFTRKHNLADHLKSHRHERPYRCETCWSRFTTKCNFNAHMKTHSRAAESESESEPETEA